MTHTRNRVSFTQLTTDEGHPLFVDPTQVAVVTDAFKRILYPIEGNDCVIDYVQARRLVLTNGTEFYVKDGADVRALLERKLNPCDCDSCKDR